MVFFPKLKIRPLRMVISICIWIETIIVSKYTQMRTGSFGYNLKKEDRKKERNNNLEISQGNEVSRILLLKLKFGWNDKFWGPTFSFMILDLKIIVSIIQLIDVGTDSEEAMSFVQWHSY